MFSRFFIDRPIFAAVLSIVITLAGGIALFTLPVAQYPLVAPPTVQVDCTYPGASAQVVSESVATPIEQQVNGVQDMLYMTSQCTNDGAYNLTVTFKQGVDMNVAQVLVQNRVSLAVPNLPDVLKQTGVSTRKKAPDILMSLALKSPDGRYDQLYLSNYATLRIKEELARLPGVSDVGMLGQRDFSMRVWVDPEKLAGLGMTAGDVFGALRDQNAQAAAGQIGQAPAVEGQVAQVPLAALGRLADVEQFEQVVVKASPDGRVVRLRDVARVELGAKNQDINCQVNETPSVSLAIFMLPDSNVLETADLLHAKMEELSRDFPEGVAYEVRYDTTPFIRESIRRVFETLQEAILLVAVVVLLFLQNWRSALIPLIAVPVAIVGTFAVLAAFGFSLNNLTLFGLVLSIGIVVDDAIVVVEAVEHHIGRGLPPRLATIRAMDEVSGPVLAIGLVLSAVFVPCAFISGLIGQFFRQFALTIATSTLISTFNSLTLSPALAALLLRPRSSGATADALPRPILAVLGGWLGYEALAPALGRLPIPGSLVAGASRESALGFGGAEAAALVIGGAAAWASAGRLNRLLGGIFRRFDAGFEAVTLSYTRLVGRLLRVGVLVLLAYAGLVGLTCREFSRTPKGFIPSQDMGYAMVAVQLPDAASAGRTWDVVRRLERVARTTPGVKYTQAMSGQSFLLGANAANFGSLFVVFDEFAKRPDPVIDRFFRWLERPEFEAWARRRLGRRKVPPRNAEALMAELRKRFAAATSEATVAVLGPVPVRGVGRAGGFRLMVEDRGDVGLRTLQEQAENLIEVAGQQPGLVGLTTVFRANVPQLYVDVDRTACLRKQVALGDLFDTLRIYCGSLHVNDFNRFGRTWQVVVQADARFRNRIEDVRRLKVRNARGSMVSLGSLADVKEVSGPLVLTRYNMHPAAAINGTAAPGTSSGTAIALMEELSRRELLPSLSVEWTELAYLELQAGNTSMIVFGFAVVMVFLVLAALYESWSLPLAVILVVPMCLLSAVSGIRFVGLDINIFTQVGFVVLVGLASKNAILIVEFAKMRREAGEDRRRATLDACRLRLRPIVMTSLAFVLGVLPLILSQGAGAEMRRILGTTVFSGMLGVTLFGLVLTPVFFSLIDRLGETRFFSSPRVRRVGELPFRFLSRDLLRRLRGPRTEEDAATPVVAEEELSQAAG